MKTSKIVLAVIFAGLTFFTSCNSSKSIAYHANTNKQQRNIEQIILPELKGPNVASFNTRELIDISLTSSMKEDNVDTELSILNSYAEANTDFSAASFMSMNLIENAKTYLGTPYKYGGTTRRGIDCSAFVQSVYRASLISLPRTSAFQAKVGKTIERKDLKRGDLIFFSQSLKSRISHCGIVESVSQTGEVFFIHSSTSLGVAMSSLNEPYWTKRFRWGKRILLDGNL